MGDILITNKTEPAIPEAGKTVIYVDQATKKVTTKDDAGLVTEYAPATAQSNSFETINTPLGTNPQAAAPDATLGLESTDGTINITGDGVTDTIDFTVVDNAVNHDGLANYVANEHIDHTQVSIGTAVGSGLNGGGTIASSINLSLDISNLSEDSTPAGGSDYLLFYDSSEGTHKRVLINDLPSSGGGGGTGDVEGPSSSTDNAIVRFDGLTGKVIQDYISNAPTITDDGVVQVKNDVKVTTNNVDRLKIDDDGLTSYIDNASPLAATLGVSEVKYYTNESANTLNFKLKYADGTVKRAVLPLLSGADWATAVSYQLNNVDSYFSSEAPAINFGISGASQFTISMTLNFDMTLTDQAYLMSFFAGTATGKVEVFWINSTFRFFIDDAYTSAQPLRANKDYHLVFVFDGSQAGNLDRAKIYVDGVLETNGSSGTIPATVNTEITNSKLGVMNRYTPTTAWFPGQIKEMSFYNKALTQTEVTNLYNLGTYSDPTAISGCTGSWWFGDNPSDNETIVVDNVGTANLTPVNVDPSDII